jgi:hypothetical protein
MKHSSYISDLRLAISGFLPQRGLPLILDKTNLRWTPRLLVSQAILMSWLAAGSLGESFDQAWAMLAQMYCSRRRPGSDCAGFLRHLARRGGDLLRIIVAHLRRQVQRLAGRRHWQVGRWVCFGVDGSRIECPMTAGNEREFGTAGKSRTGPQQFLTILFHMASGMIWDYRRGHARCSEREHLLEMLGELPMGSLLVADAGFTGYEFFRRIIDSGRHVLVRVGSNVKLLANLNCRIRQQRTVVYLWPKAAQKKKRAPLMLRLITLVDQRNRRIHLLSDVLEESRLEEKEAGQIYRQRWGVELIYRSLKQTMGKRKMRCDCPAHAAAELDWSVVGLWMLGLLTLERVLQAGQPPGRCSPALALRAVRQGTEPWPKPAKYRSLPEALSAAVKDSYIRTLPRRARHWPHKKRQEWPAEPRARMASEMEIQLANELRDRRAAA